MIISMKVCESLIPREELRTPAGQALLKQAHDERHSVHCLCTTPPLEMFVRHSHGQYHLVKARFTGHLHTPSCPSFELADHESHLDEGSVILKPTFELSHYDGAASPATRSLPPLQKTISHISNPTDLRGLLSTLWLRAELHKWFPRMRGKRTWGVVRTRLIAAAEGIFLGRQNLLDRLYIPEPFQKDKAANTPSSVDQLIELCSVHQGMRRFTIVVGMIKQMRESRFGYQLLLKHAPDLSLYVRHPVIDTQIRARQFEFEGLSDSNATLVAALLVERSRKGYFNVLNLDVLRTTKEYLPAGNVFEEDLLTKAVELDRSLIRKINVDASDPFDEVVALLTDTGDQPTPLRINLNQTPPCSEITGWSWNPAINRLDKLQFPASI